MSRVGGSHPDDLSRCASEDEFLDKLTIALKKSAPRQEGRRLLRRDHRRRSHGRGVFELPSRSDCADFQFDGERHGKAPHGVVTQEDIALAFAFRISVRGAGHFHRAR